MPIQRTPTNARESQSQSLAGSDAVILDLDGVVTETASLHRAAWKEVFDHIVRRAAPDQPPFDADEDYRRFVDGMPRLDGVRSFLASRGIELPDGNEDDTVANMTVRGIGNTKNERFTQLLRQRGPGVFEDAVQRIKQWKAQGLPIAVVSGSRNCAAILESAGLTELFDVRVDGSMLDELGMPGKPEPDMYLEAARRLNVAPDRAVVFEDAIAGVQAARRGGFGLVVGVGSDATADDLLSHGADLVVAGVGAFAIETGQRGHHASGFLNLLDSLDAFKAQLAGRRPALFLDYDGTLTPIVERPELAQLGEDMRDVLRRLARVCPVAIISGRDRADVQRLVGLDGLIFAGSHGFDIRGPDNLAIQHTVGEGAAPRLDQVQQMLGDSIGSIGGVQIERKRFTIAVHYRNVAEPQVPTVEQAVDRAIERVGDLRKTHGKKVFEIQPSIDWDKGKAVLWLLEATNLDAPDVLPIYIGDDLTDEDAFAALRGRGVGVVVALEDRKSSAEYCLRNVAEVRQFLQWLHDFLVEHAAS